MIFRFDCLSGPEVLFQDLRRDEIRDDDDDESPFPILSLPL